MRLTGLRLEFWKKGQGIAVRRFSFAVALFVMLFSAAGAAASTRISSRGLPGLGQVLVNGQGKTLYIFVPDKHHKVTCIEECAEIWPPALLSGRQKPIAAGKVKRALLSSDPDPSVGERVITYKGWPLYTYATDVGPGMATGQAIDLNGGLWYVISPTGRVIKTKPRAG